MPAALAGPDEGELGALIAAADGGPQTGSACR